MLHYFRDDNIRKVVAERICDEKKCSADFCSEFRSQIAKGVIELSKYAADAVSKEGDEGIHELQDGDFFVVQRSNKFFGGDTIEEFNVYLSQNEIIGKRGDHAHSIGDYYAKKLTELLPYKNYDSMFSNNGFYVYMSKAETSTSDNKARFYQKMEQIFVLVASELAKMSEEDFVIAYGDEDLCKTRSITSDKLKEIHWLKEFKCELTSSLSVFPNHKPTRTSFIHISPHMPEVISSFLWTLYQLEALFVHYLVEPLYIP